MSRLRLALPLLALILAAGCGKPTEWIRTAVTRDLSCKGGEVTIKHVAGKPNEKEGWGCGQRGRWRKQCDAERCWWERVE